MTKVSAISQQEKDITYTLSILIINWNTKDLTINCLNSIQKNLSDIDHEIIVVDNASSDCSVRAIKGRFSEVRLIENISNLGFSKANNQAYSISKGEFILLLNSDTLIKPHSIGKMLEYMQNNHEVGICGARLINPDGTSQRSIGTYPTFKKYLINNLPFDFMKPYGWNEKFKNSLTINGQKKPFHVDVVPGACLMTRRKIIDEIGFLDERFYFYSEDVDYCYRVKQASWQIVCLPEVEVIHFGGQSSSKDVNRFLLESVKSRKHFFSKHYNGWKVVIWRHIISVVFFVSLIKACVAFLFRISNTKKRNEHINSVIRYYKSILVILGSK
jgi:hypothetical protein